MSKRPTKGESRSPHAQTDKATELAATEEQPPSGNADWPRLHLWEIQPLRDIAVVFAVIGLLYLGYALRVVTVPMLLALLLAYLFEPVVQWLTRERTTRGRAHGTGGVSRPVAALILIVSAALLIVIPTVLAVGFGTAEGVKLVRSVGTNLRATVQFVEASSTTTQPEADQPSGDQAPDDQATPNPSTPIQSTPDTEPAPPTTTNAPPTPRRSLSHEDYLARQPEAARAAYDRLPEGLWRTIAIEASKRVAIDQETKQAATKWARENADRLTSMTYGTAVQALQTAANTGKTIGLILFAAFLTAFFFFFFSTGFGKILAFWRELIPENHRDQTIDLIKKMDRVTSAFIRGRLTIMAVQCVVFSIGYWIAGVPAGIVLGLIVGILALFPYISILGVPAAILLMFLDPPDGFRGTWWWMLAAPIVVYMIGQALDEYVLTPSIQGKATNMDAPTVLFASLAGGILAGFYGLLVAIPVAACLKILIIEVVWPRFRKWVEGAVRDPLPVGRS
ncbi:MAG: AI-2E family transporter, partial [Phycisphaerales bacterium]